MDRDAILKDLRSQFGAKKSVLYADEIASLLGKSEQALANLKARGGLPFPVSKVGGRLCASIYDVADWLAGDTPSAAPSSAKTPPGKPPAVPKPATRRASLGKSLLALKSQIDFLSAVFAGLEAISLSAGVPDGEGKKSKKGPSKKAGGL